MIAMARSLASCNQKAARIRSVFRCGENPFFFLLGKVVAGRFIRLFRLHGDYTFGAHEKLHRQDQMKNPNSPVREAMFSLSKMRSGSAADGFR